VNPRIGSHEQAVAHREQDAAEGDAGAENPMEPGTSAPLRLPESAQELVAIPQPKKE
jgi:hypothetical protein